jgi:hypothetical protein
MSGKAPASLKREDVLRDARAMAVKVAEAVGKPVAGKGNSGGR